MDSPPSGRPSNILSYNRTTDTLFAIASFIVPFLAFDWYVLNHFYNVGGYTSDSGWFAYIIGKPSIGLPLSPLVDGLEKGSAYGYHFSPAFAVISWIGALLPQSPPQLLSLFLAAIYALVGPIVYAALRFGSAASLPRPLVCLAALVSAFNGVTLASVVFPHFEAAVPILSLAFFTLRALGRTRAALVPYGACLLFREDAGLYIAAPLALLALAKAWETKSVRIAWHDLVLILIPLFYAPIAIALQKILFNGGFHLKAEFIGSPPYSHLTSSLLAERLESFFRNRRYVYFPFVVTLITAIVTRRWSLLIGFAVTLPWIAFCFLGVPERIGFVNSYYAVPTILGIGWPAVAFATWGADERRGSATLALGLQFLVAGSSIVGFPGSGHLPDNAPWKMFRPLPRAVSAERTDALVRWIGRNKGEFGHMIVGDGVVALAPELFDEPEWYQWDDTWSASRFEPVNTIIFFQHEPMNLVLSKFLETHPRAIVLTGEHTNLVVATDREALAGGTDTLKLHCLGLPSRTSISEIGVWVPLAGWSPGGWRGGRWTDGNEAHLSATLCSIPESDFLINVDATGFVTERHPEVHVDVLANDRPIATWTFHNGEAASERSIIVPREAVQASRALHLVFKVDAPVSPAELGLSSDTRMLGLRVTNIAVEPGRVKPSTP
jgi:hypothetical protein